MSGARNKTTRNPGGANTRSTGASQKSSARKPPPAPDPEDYGEEGNIEYDDLEYEPPNAIAEDEEVFGDIPGVERKVYGHMDNSPVTETPSSSKSSGKGAFQGGSRVMGGYKASIKNPRVSQEAKDHAQQILDENDA